MKGMRTIVSLGVIFGIIVLGSVLLWKREEPSKQENVPSPTVTQEVVTPSLAQPSETPTSANIIVTSPKAMEEVTLPIIIKGKARVFENQFSYRVLDGNKTIAEGTAYAHSQNPGEFGDFSIQIISLPATKAATLTLQVFDNSAKDGTEQDTVSIPVTFKPSQ